jgi:hypothetical protein
LQRPIIVGVGGVESNVGKTTLMCELLQAFPGWEAIKTTRGHYRSCGKEPDACCVSHLLAKEPVLRSGRLETFAVGKDTGRYWESGASNVHWLIATDSQVEKGIELALERVRSFGVFVEGNSFSEYVATDYFLMVSRAEASSIKKSAKRAIARTSAIYCSDPASSQSFTSKWQEFPVYSSAELPCLIEEIRRAARMI